MHIIVLVCVCRRMWVCAYGWMTVRIRVRVRARVTILPQKLNKVHNHTGGCHSLNAGVIAV